MQSRGRFAQSSRCRGPDWWMSPYEHSDTDTMDLNNKVVLVTGGTGSFGRKFTETVLQRYSVKKLIVFSRDELKQSEMHRQFPQTNVRYFIGDVRDRDRLRRAMRGVDVVIHAAAMKQVPACEYNP